MYVLFTADYRQIYIISSHSVYITDSLVYWLLIHSTFQFHNYYISEKCCQLSFPYNCIHDCLCECDIQYFLLFK